MATVEKEEDESSSDKEDGLAIDEEDNKQNVESRTGLVTGKRQRTTVQAFTSAPPPPAKKELEFEVGRGTLLGEIEVVTEMMKKTTSDSYAPLHRILYKIVGPLSVRKRHIRRFNGFPFDTDSSEYDSKLALIKRLKTTERKAIFKQLGLTMSTTTISDLMDFLMKPVETKKPPAKRKRSKSTDGTDKTTKKQSKSKTPVKKSKAKTPKKQPKTKTTPKKGTPKKATSASKVYTDSEDSLSDTGSSEELPPTVPEQEQEAKRRRLSESFTDISRDDSFTAPSEEEIVRAIKTTLDNIDLEEVSMKQAVAKVYGLFPGADLADKKSFIKEKIREIIG